MNTKSITLKAAEAIGVLCSLIYPRIVTVIIKSLRNRLYTGYIRHRFGHLGNSVFIWHPLTLVGEKYMDIGDNNIFEGGIQLSARQVTDNPPTLRIGNNCLIRYGCHITSANNIVIGNDLLTGTNVIITDNAHGMTDEATLHTSPRCRPIVSKGGVRIGNNVWLGNNVCVMPNVTIGDGVVVGANSVVTHDLPAYSVAVGVPARIVSKRPLQHSI